MYPSLGEIWGFELRSYHVVRWAYFVLAAVLTAYLGRRRGIGAGRLLGAFAVGIPSALVGGHLLNVFEAWPAYRGRPEEVWNVLAGGASIYGALVFGVASGIAYFRWQRMPVRDVLDAAAPALALGEAMTRVGCFLNGCCFGHPTHGPLGVTFPRASYVFHAQLTAGLIAPDRPTVLPVHPTQLYSAFLCAVLFVVLLGLYARARLFPGALFALFVGAYGVQRLVVGMWRGDGILYPLEVSPWLSAGAIVVAGVLWVVWRGTPVDLRAATAVWEVR